MGQLNQADTHAVGKPRGGVSVEPPVIPINPPNGGLNGDPILGPMPKVDTLQGVYVNNDGSAS